MKHSSPRCFLRRLGRRLNTDDAALAELQQNALRYATVKRMTLRAYSELYHHSLATGKPLDALVDEMVEAYAALDPVQGRK